MLPREKALTYGISSLNNEELIALIIKSGYKNNTVFNVSKELLKKANGFSNMLSLNYEELIEIKGISKAKALEILAILEIAKRLNNIEYVKEQDLNSPSKIFDWLRFNVGFSNVEEFLCVFLTTAGKIIKSEVLFKGTKNKSIIAVDEILRKAILLKASGIIICHNHPGGTSSPSPQDLCTTNTINSACKLMDIKLLDHIIVTKSGYFSFKQEGLL